MITISFYFESYSALYIRANAALCGNSGAPASEFSVAALCYATAWESLDFKDETSVFSVKKLHNSDLKRSLVWP